MDNLINKVVVRPWSDFLELSRFGWPDFNNIGHSLERLTANFEYYLGNYFVICALIGLYAIINHPWLLIALLAISGGYVYLYNIRTQPLVFNGRILTPQETKYAFIAGSSLLLIYCTGFVLLYYISVMILIVLAHSLTRKRSVKAKLNRSLSSVSGTSLAASLSKVAEKIIDGDNYVTVKETARYSPSYESLLWCIFHILIHLRPVFLQLPHRVLLRHRLPPVHHSPL